jgi:hypothetical protein
LRQSDFFNCKEPPVSNTTYSPSLNVKPAAPAVLNLLRELFKATPLYIFATALKAR